MQPQNPTEKPLIVAVPGPLIIKQLPAALSNYSRVVRTPLNLVLHATDGHEGVTQDTDGATEISKPLPKGHEKSFHYIVDGDSVTQCVEDQYVAWHASRRGNAVGIGIEMCGRATQTREQWLDPISLATIQITARLCADLCAKHSIPAVLVEADGLLQEKKGITTHNFVSKAFKQSDHYDPGPNFPLDEFIAAVKAAIRERLVNAAAAASSGPWGFGPPPPGWPKK